MKTAISKRIRFEVFKRDKFTCQYCGSKAPDVILQIEHIHPKAEGGTDDILNLTTACVDCNSGKGARLLSENAAIEKKRAQLGLLQDRREQMQMVYEWQRELLEISQEEIDLISSWLETETKSHPNERGCGLLKTWIKSYGFEEVLVAMRENFARYYKGDDETWNEAFNRIPRTIKFKRLQKTDPERAKYLYITGILRNRLNYVNFGLLPEIYQAWESWQHPLDDLKAIAVRVTSWTQFSNAVAEYLNEAAKSGQPVR